MKFESPLIKGTLVKRYKRFLADVTLENGSIVTAHVANPGSMLELAKPGSTVWLEINDDPKRKLKYSWKLIETNQTFIGVDTHYANKIIKEALDNNAFGLNYESYEIEIKYGENSRIDFLLYFKQAPKMFLEVKSVTLSREAGLAEFPDSKTLRGAKHMNELTEMVKKGFQSTILFLVQRSDIDLFKIAGDIDPNYQESYNNAIKQGVRVLCYDCVISKEGITIGKRLDLANVSNSA